MASERKQVDEELARSGNQSLVRALRGCFVFFEQTEVEENSSLISEPCGKRTLVVYPARGKSALTLLDVGALPENLDVRCDLQISLCPGLEVLPSGFKVHGNFEMSKCAQLERVEGDLTVFGNMTVKECPNLSNLGSSLHVEGSLSVSQCSSLEIFPEKFTVTGDAELHFLERLESLSINSLFIGGMFIGGYFDDAIMWTNEEYLALGSVGGSREMLERNKLVAADFAMGRVGCNFRVALCKKLVLPSHVAMNGTCCLRVDEADPSLPQNFLPAQSLRVGGSLLLHGCREGLVIPPDMQVLGCEIRLVLCHGIAALPSSLFRRKKIQNVYLEGTAIAQEEVDRLSEEFPNLRFHVSLEVLEALNSRGVSQFNDMQEAVNFWYPGLEVEPYVEPAYRREFALFLSKLRNSKEFQNETLREGFTARVQEVLEMLCTDEASRDELLIRMCDSVNACSDKPALALSHMTLLCEISHARGSRNALRDLGRRVQRLEVVNAHARRTMEKLRVVDDVCVYFCFELALKDILNLPVSVKMMHFPSFVQIEQEVFDFAAEEAMSISEEDFEKWMNGWSEWQRQARLETIPNWNDLELGASISSERLKKCQNLQGESISDPITFYGKIWSFSDLVRHFVQTGMDLENRVTTIPTFTANIRRLSVLDSLENLEKKQTADLQRSTCPKTFSPKRKLFSWLKKKDN